MRKIGIITGSRGEYGYVRPVIRAIEKDPGLDYELIVTDMHLLDAYGYSVSEIEKDGFKIGARIHNTLDGYSNTTMAKSLGIFLLQLPDVVKQLGLNMILIAGDRGEQLMAAITGAHLYIPVAHIQAGELSGNIDGITRHAITKFAHIHFAANEASASRVKALGEQDFRIHITGAPQLDELIQNNYPTTEEVKRKLGLPKDQPLILLVQHPVTEEFENAEDQMTKTMEAIIKLEYPAVVVLPNSDAGRVAIYKVIQNYRKPYIKLFKNLPRNDYAAIMKAADVMVGNSSSGIIESPLFDLPVVNIGNRQKGREYSENVISVPHQSQEIVKAIRQALTDDYKTVAKNSQSVYGDGKASERIVKILKEVPINEELLNKQSVFPPKAGQPLVDNFDK